MSGPENSTSRRAGPDPRNNPHQGNCKHGPQEEAFQSVIAPHSTRYYAPSGYEGALVLKS